ncbi:hypothetical protein [Monoglobus pectinilyticus]|uniref:Uncharacterized protein n=1 Tax=Monoglobus pectinilyticus TaxID=1981510 RepID=A0A2K9P088_9FIRM|nr:hypothetical protein [Monoglobus pectinilyticus]AUO18681.1 hypothetical protein B9O19_00498 [Monoglobus pectinilyticus]
MSVNDSFDTLIKCQKIVSIQENLLKSKIRNIDNALSYITGVKTKLTPFSESPFTTDMSFKTELEKSCIPRIEMINKIKSNNVVSIISETTLSSIAKKFQNMNYKLSNKLNTINFNDSITKMNIQNITDMYSSLPSLDISNTLYSKFENSMSSVFSNLPEQTIESFFDDIISMENNFIDTFVEAETNEDYIKCEESAESNTEYTINAIRKLSNSNDTSDEIVSLFKEVKDELVKSNSLKEQEINELKKSNSLKEETEKENEKYNKISLYIEIIPIILSVFFSGNTVDYIGLQPPQDICNRIQIESPVEETINEQLQNIDFSQTNEYSEETVTEQFQNIDSSQTAAYGEESSFVDDEQ